MKGGEDNKIKQRHYLILCQPTPMRIFLTHQFAFTNFYESLSIMNSFFPTCRRKIKSLGSELFIGREWNRVEMGLRVWGTFFNVMQGSHWIPIVQMGCKG